MLFSKSTLIVLLVLATLIVLTEKAYVDESQSWVRASCETHVQYDKSGDLYCVDSPNKSIKTAQK
jgi:hypothetical protein